MYIMYMIGWHNVDIIYSLHMHNVVLFYAVCVVCTLE